MKIDTTKIEGFADMSAEEKLNAVLAYEIEAPAPSSAEVDKLKASLSKANSEAANYKRQLNEKMTADEQKEQERADAEKLMREELAQLRRERTVDGYKAKFMANGYDAETADKMATSLPDGVPDSFFETDKSFMDAKIQAIKAEALNSQPTLTTGKAPSATSVEDNMIATFTKFAMGQ